MNAKVVGIVGVIILVVGIIGSYMSFVKSAGKLKNSVVTQWSQNQNAYDKFWKTVKEQAQIPDKYKDDFKELLVADTSGKYGEGGSDALMLWSNDRGIQLPQESYTKLMTSIEAGRADFAREQKTLLDKQLSYRNKIENSYGGMVWAGFAGHPSPVSGAQAPTEDLDGDGLLTPLDYPIVTSERTQKAFKEGKDEALDVFGSNRVRPPATIVVMARL